MNRRSLLARALAVFGASSILSRGARAGKTDALPLDLASSHLPRLDPWPERWRRLPMQPVVGASDLGEEEDPRVRRLASSLFDGPGKGRPVVFRYHGGSEPGSIRTVLPVLLFRKFDPQTGDAAGPWPEAAWEPSPVYLLAHCLKHAAPRTFRLDRMEVAG